MPKAKTISRRPVKDSQSVITQIVLPNDANPLGSILGGTVMHLVDMVAAIAAQRHCGRHVVTASVDHMDFRCPIRVGEIIILKSSVNRVFRCSMEVGVKVYREVSFTHQREHTSSAYLTFVAIDENRKPTTAIQVVPESADEKQRYIEAGNRRRGRMSVLSPRPSTSDNE